jgi:hypothetical protein
VDILGLSVNSTGRRKGTRRVYAHITDAVYEISIPPTVSLYRQYCDAPELIIEVPTACMGVLSVDPPLAAFLLLM